MGSSEEEEEVEEEERGMEDSDWRSGNVGAEGKGGVWIGRLGTGKQTTGSEGYGDGSRAERPGVTKVGI